MSRRSTVAVSTFVPALKVLSTTLPVSTFFSVVRTKAPPLPGLTCWNAVTVHSWPSMLSTRPFFRPFVVATRASLQDRGCGARELARCRRQGNRSDFHQLARCAAEQLGSAVPDEQRVLDPHPATAGQVDAGLDGHGHPGEQPPGAGGAQQRR